MSSACRSLASIARRSMKHCVLCLNRQRRAAGAPSKRPESSSSRCAESALGPCKIQALLTTELRGTMRWQATLSYLNN